MPIMAHIASKMNVGGSTQTYTITGSGRMSMGDSLKMMGSMHGGVDGGAGTLIMGPSGHFVTSINTADPSEPGDGGGPVLKGVSQGGRGIPGMPAGDTPLYGVIYTTAQQWADAKTRLGITAP